jgi:hypothetical protein
MIEREGIVQTANPPALRLPQFSNTMGMNERNGQYVVAQISPQSTCSKGIARSPSRL